MKFEFGVTAKQHQFIKADADEVLFGGAAGGGKSHGQLIDAFCFACQYPGSRQLILRKSFPELERSLIAKSLALFPQEAGCYAGAKHLWILKNKSMIEFGFCGYENDVLKYQSAEYDIVRFDELTHFSQFQYLYLLSRIRGTNGYPKQVKSTTNPGGIGHGWVKERFIDAMPWGEKTMVEGRSRIFIPAMVQDNKFLMHSDPGYLKRLEELPENEKRALLFGEWNLFEGRFFSEFRREIHVIKQQPIPQHYRRYIAIDYGLDMLACYWAAFDGQNRAIVYRELYESNLIISQAAQKILLMTAPNEKIEQVFAPPDLWGRGADTGKSQNQIFFEAGLSLSRVSAAREAGWLNLREWLKIQPDETGKERANLVICDNCVNLIRCMEQLQFSPVNPNDCASAPHELTHAPDALRYLLISHPTAICETQEKDNYDSFLYYGT